MIVPSGEGTMALALDEDHCGVDTDLVYPNVVCAP
jgi:hypothetical protein